MKPETYVGIVLFAAFLVFTALAGSVAKEAIYLFGCFMFGWSVPAMSRAILNFFRKHKTA